MYPLTSLSIISSFSGTNIKIIVPEKKFSGAYKKNVAGKLPLSLNRSSQKTIGLETVSYTHLDVYKRQT